MSDNTQLSTNTGTGDKLVTKDVTHGGDAGVKLQSVSLMGVSGAEGSYVIADINGDATNGLDVDVTRLPALPAGTNNIGDVDVLTLPALPAGTNNIGDVDILSIAAGDNNIGNVDIVTLPALPAGTNNIGDIDVLTLPATTNAGATAKTSDYDTGAGTDTVTMFGIAIPASGGAVQGGTATNPLRTDPTGTTTQPVSGTVTANLAAGTNNIGDVDILSIAAGDNNIGNVDVITLPALPAGTNNIGDVDVLTLPAIPTGTNSIGTVQPGNTANTTPWLVTDTPATTGGLTAGRIISAATTNATSVKGSAGQLYTILAHNINAAVRYLKLYNKATAPTVGTDTPILTMPIPGNTAGTGFVINCDKGWAFSLGVAAAITTGVADADTGAVAANEIVINFGYK